METTSIDQIMSQVTVLRDLGDVAVTMTVETPGVQKVTAKVAVVSPENKPRIKPMFTGFMMLKGTLSFNYEFNKDGGFEMVAQIRFADLPAM